MHHAVDSHAFALSNLPSLRGLLLRISPCPGSVRRVCVATRIVAQTLADEMGRYDQQHDDSTPFPEALSQILGSKKLIKHKDSDVRLVVACCLSDLLRIHAPDTPFDDNQLRDVFQLLVSQCAGIEDIQGASYHRHVYLIERLAVVKSFVLLPEMADDLVLQTFETFFDAVNVEHGMRVEKHMLDILNTCVEGEEGVSQQLVDQVLQNLIEPRRSERPAAYRLARAFLQRCANELQRAVLSFFQDCMPSTISVTGEAEGSELREDWRELLVEMAAISPDMVTYLLPQLEDVVAMEDETIRLQGTELLANLFLLDECNIAAQLPSLFTNSFLGRVNDVSSNVRLVAVEHAARVLVKKTSLATPLLKALEERVMDSSDKVRQALVVAVCAGAEEHLDVFAPLLAIIAPRMGDKKQGVRKAARDGLCALYRAHATAHLTEHPDAKAVPAELHCIPQQLLHCYGVDAGHDVESKLELEQLLVAKMLPLDEQLRLRSFCALHAALQPYQRRALRALLRSKRACQAEMARWLELHEERRALAKGSKADVSKAAARNVKADGDAGLKAEQNRIVASMCKRLPQGDRLKEIWEEIGQIKDQKVHAQLRVLSSAGSSLTEVLAAQKEWRQRMGPRLKEAQVPLLQAMGSVPAMTLLWRDGVEQLLEEVSNEIKSDPDRCCAAANLGGCTMPVLQMLNDVAEQSPQTFGTAGPPLASALQAACSGSELDTRRRPALLLLLRLVHAASPQLQLSSPSTRKTLVALLCQLCCTCKDGEVGKLAAQALSTHLLAPMNREKTFDVLLTKLAPALDPDSPSSMHTCALAVLGALAKRDNAALGSSARRVPMLAKLMEAALPESGDVSPDEAAAALPAPLLQARCAAQLLMVKALANEALGNASTAARPAAATTALVAASPDGAGPTRVETLVHRLLGALEVEGRLGAAAEAGEEAQAKVRLAAGCALLKLIRMPALKVEAHMGPLGWHKLALLMHDPDPSTRLNFCEKIAKESKRRVIADKRETKLGAPAEYQATRRIGLPPHFIAMLALAVLDPDPVNAQAAKKHLIHLVGIWRACADKLDQPRALPEMQLPWLVHTLAHHPDYELDDAAKISAQRCLDAFVEACLASDTGNYDLLCHMCTLIMTGVDKVEPDGQQTRALGAIARLLINARSVGKAISRSPLPPNVALPALMYFKPRADQAPVNVNELLPVGFTLRAGLGKSSVGSTHLKKHAIVPYADRTDEKRRRVVANESAPKRAAPSPLSSPEGVSCGDSMEIQVDQSKERAARAARRGVTENLDPHNAAVA